jgi:hypothetical protein
MRWVDTFRFREIVEDLRDIEATWTIDAVHLYEIE